MLSILSRPRLGVLNGKKIPHVWESATSILCLHLWAFSLHIYSKGLKITGVTFPESCTMCYSETAVFAGVVLCICATIWIVHIQYIVN